MKGYTLALAVVVPFVFACSDGPAAPTPKELTVEETPDAVDLEAAAIIAATRDWLAPRVGPGTIGVLNAGRTADRATVMLGWTDQDPEYVEAVRAGDGWTIEKGDGRALFATVGSYPTASPLEIGFFVLRELPSTFYDWRYFYHKNYPLSNPYEFPWQCCSGLLPTAPGTYQYLADAQYSSPRWLSYNAGWHAQGRTQTSTYGSHTPIYEYQFQLWEWGARSAYGASCDYSRSHVNHLIPHGEPLPCHFNWARLTYRIVGSDACPIGSIDTQGSSTMNIGGGTNLFRIFGLPTLEASVEGNCETPISTSYSMSNSLGMPMSDCGAHPQSQPPIPAYCWMYNIPAGTTPFTVYFTATNNYRLGISKTTTFSREVTRCTFSLTASGTSHVAGGYGYADYTMTPSIGGNCSYNGINYLWRVLRPEGPQEVGCGNAPTCRFYVSPGFGDFTMRADASVWYELMTSPTATAYVNTTVDPWPPPPPLNAYITGPTNIYPYDTYTWTANPSGGTPPYSYNWTINGGWAGNGQSMSSSSFSPSSYYEMAVRVTDSRNVETNAYLGVYTNTGTCLPGQEGCNEYSPPPGTGKATPKRPVPPKGPVVGTVRRP